MFFEKLEDLMEWKDSEQKKPFTNYMKGQVAHQLIQVH